MNHDVPQPTTATRSPRVGRDPATSAASTPARRQQAGCEAISRSVRSPATMFGCIWGASLPITDFPAFLHAADAQGVGGTASVYRVSPAHVPPSPVAATDRMK